jgi:hypothetical protein
MSREAASTQATCRVLQHSNKLPRVATFKQTQAQAAGRPQADPCPCPYRPLKRPSQGSVGGGGRYSPQLLPTKWAHSLSAHYTGC